MNEMDKDQYGEEASFLIAKLKKIQISY